MVTSVKLFLAILFGFLLAVIVMLIIKATRTIRDRKD